MKRGLTLVEVLIATVMLAAVAGVAVFLLNAMLKTWVSQEARAGIGINLDWRMEEMVRDLREAREVQSLAGRNEIRFTRDGALYYIYYLYNENDTYGPPPSFNQDEYKLKRAVLTEDIDGTFAYGAGKNFIGGVLPPPSSELSASGNVLTIDLSIERKDETIRSRTEVRPRNL